MLQYVYSSALAPYISGLLDEKRSMGYTYDNEAKMFRRFDKYWSENNGDLKVLTPESVKLWLTQQEPTEGPSTMQQKYGVVRILGLYMAGLGLPSYIPECDVHRPKPLYNILTPEEIKAVMAEVDSYVPQNNDPKCRVMGIEKKVFYRLILTTGMRNNECCTICIKNIDLKDKTITLYKAKGHKDRLVYFADDVADMLKDYIKFLKSAFGNTIERLFPGYDPKAPMSSSNVRNFFSECWSRTAFAESCEQKPTVHSLRHTYTCMRINQWALEGKDVDQMIDYLCRQLGHKSRNETYTYYHQVMEAFKIIQQKTANEADLFPEVKRR